MSIEPDFNSDNDKNRKFHDRLLKLAQEAEENRDKLRDFPEYRTMLEEVIELAYNMRPSIDEIKKDVDSNRGNAEMLNDWKKAQDAKHRIDAEVAQAEAKRLGKRVSALESYIIEDALPKAIEVAIQDKKLRSVPFVYYGLNTHRLIYTPATIRFLGIDQLPGNLSLGSLISYVKKRKGNRNVRRVFLTALKEQKQLNHLPAETITGKDIYLTTTPYKFSEGYSKTVGVGISFNPPVLENIKHMRRGINLNGIHKAILHNISYVRDRIQSD